MDDNVNPRLRKIQEIVAEAIPLPPEERKRLLDERCAGDTEMRSEVESLIAAYDGWNSGTTTSGSGRRDPTARLGPGETVGQYMIHEFIGSGAFGEVYRAERMTEMRQIVALKILRPGQDTRQVLARFEAERQAMALMSHPCIPKIYDAGATEQGRMYFTMEYIQGVSITEHCDKHRLNISERLKLFTRVCEAVQHAHQRGIIHRDLKPSNILVEFGDQGAVPRLIDFGVVKAINQPLTAHDTFTEHDQVIGTPAYMSPEQVAPTLQGIDTRSDVYALGVLLYQLITGFMPFDTQRVALEEIRRLIRDEDPPRPSTKLTTKDKTQTRQSEEAAKNRRMDMRSLTRVVRGDLDKVTMKCLEKDRDRRYSFASDLARDIERYLNHEPVEASEPGVWYKTQKFVRRHRAGVASGALILVILIAGVAAVTRAEMERRRAEKEKQAAVAENRLHQARRVVEEARGLFYDVAYDSERMQGRVSEELNAKLKEALSLDPDLIDAEVLMTHYLVLSGDRDAALRRTTKLVERFPKHVGARSMLSALRGQDSEEGARLDQWFYYRSLVTEDDDAAIELLEQSLEYNPWFFNAKWQLALRRYAREYDEAMLEDATLLTQVEPDRALTWDLRATGLAVTERYPEAIEAYRRAIDLDPDGWRGYYGRAWARNRSNDHAGALEDIRKAAELNPESGSVQALLGAILLKVEEWPSAIDALNRAIDSGHDTWRVYRDRADGHRQLRKLDEALLDADRAVERVPSEVVRQRAELLELRADVLRDLGRIREAREMFEHSIELEPSPRAYYNLGRLELREGRPSAAVAAFDEAARLGAGWEVGRGVGLWCEGRYDVALDDLWTVAPRPLYHWVYLWIWSIEKARGLEANADYALKAARTVDNGEEPIFGSVIEFLSGNKTGNDLESAAVSDKERLYAYFFLAEDARARGEDREAARWYESALELDLTFELEHDLVHCFLADLAS